MMFESMARMILDLYSDSKVSEKQATYARDLYESLIEEGLFQGRDSGNRGEIRGCNDLRWKAIAHPRIVNNVKWSTRNRASNRPKQC